ncbi:SusC/RagA family TonB-linked outer membrane protein [Psychroflexus planctonicus]|nr:TonB-dependent receptor [Psychroflexus planctonicus]
MLKNYLFIVFCIMSLSMSAQTIDISGTVIDGGSQIPLPDANVQVEGTEKGASTDFDGVFTLTGVPSDGTLVVSYLGFVTQKIPIDGKTTFEVVLQPDTEALEDVVVIGYGQSSKRNISGSVSKVGAADIKKLDPINAAQSLQGTAAGVNVTPQGGSPGAEANIRIRGVATNGDASPLIILDGFQYDGGLNSINPQDIENITVLKDAQAAIYGTIASNGVILVTTKSGKRNQSAKFEYQTYYGFQETTRELPLLNATEYALLLNESYANSGQTSPIQNLSGLGRGTDWQDEIFEVAPIMNHNLSIRGGSEKTSYSFSGSLLDQDGIVGGDKSSFVRKTASLSIDTDLNDKLNFKTKLFYTNQESKGLNTFGLGSVLFNAINMAPTIGAGVDNLDGEIDLGNEVVNPITQIRNTYNESVNNRLSGTVQATYDYADNLNIQARLGFNRNGTEFREFIPVFNYGPGKVFNRLEDNLVNQNKIINNDYTFDLFNTYSNTFEDIHDVTFLLGMTVYKSFGEGLFGSRTGVPSNSFDFADIGTATGAGENNTAGSYAYDVRRLSYFGRLEYTLDDKYLFSAMLRRDSSTRFGPNNRVGYFPSITSGWIISDENFFPQSDNIDFLKLRASYGIMGNDRIGDFLYLSLLTGQATYANGEDGLVNGIAQGPIPNPNAQWEEAVKTDFGLDLRLFNNKVNFTFDYYRNDTDKLLISNIPVSGIFGSSAPGASSPTINAGKVRNQGLEFELNYSDNITDDFSFGAGFNIATIQNEVLSIRGADFVEGGAFGVGQPLPSRMEVGQPIGYFYGLRTDGIFQSQAEVDAHPSQAGLGATAQPGDIRYVDSNGDGVINADDRVKVGNPIPDFTFGFNLSLNYKNFDMNTYVFGNLGNDIVRNYERDQPNVNQLGYRLDRWTGPGTSSTVPRATTSATANKVFSDFFVEDGSFARIQTIALGYTFEENLLQKIGLKQLRIYGKIDNVYTFTDYTGYDPTASSGAPIGSGIDFGFYPLPRTYIVGLNANF